MGMSEEKKAGKRFYYEKNLRLLGLELEHVEGKVARLFCLGLKKHDFRITKIHIHVVLFLLEALVQYCMSVSRIS